MKSTLKNTLFLALLGACACQSNTQKPENVNFAWDKSSPRELEVKEEHVQEAPKAEYHASKTTSELKKVETISVSDGVLGGTLGGVSNYSTGMGVGANGSVSSNKAMAKIIKSPVMSKQRRLKPTSRSVQQKTMSSFIGDPVARLALDESNSPKGDEDRVAEKKTHPTYNPFTKTRLDSLSTFAVDVDTGSYSLARNHINKHQIPPAHLVRVEEFVNYFSYAYPEPTNNQPFSVHMDMAPSPFSKDKHLLRVGVQGKKVSRSERKPSHLTFLVDVSGSMNSGDKLGLAKKALRVLVNNLGDGDTVSLVTYAGNTRVVLEPTSLDERGKIMSAIEDLSARGSTAMGTGLDLAYAQAASKLSSKSESRVIVLSDGDANVGRTSHQAILETIAGRVKEGVTLSTIGFGMGNYKDNRMEQLANKGNGNYYYIDSVNEAKKVFQEQLGGTLEVIAKDVKIQVEFDKDVVESYRLVGYENRDIADVDFRNDKVDAGEIGAGHRVTAIYELNLRKNSQAPLKVNVRHKKPNGKSASENVYLFDKDNSYASFDGASEDFRFAVAVAASAEVLRQSQAAKGWSWNKIRSIAKSARSASDERQEFVDLLEKLDERKVAMNR